MICKICNQTVTENSHWYKNHKITQKTYFEQYFPRFDLFDKSKIIFKSEDSYFNQDFNNKINLKKYLESISKEDGIKYLISFLNKRKQFKNLIYAPGEFECRSLLFPSIKYIEKTYGTGSYAKICNDTGLKLKYNYNQDIKYLKEPKEIICDTREQSPYIKINIPIVIKKLDFADYCPEPNPNNIFVERKELSDWAGVMSKGYDRFCRELDRAKKENAYILILIEGKYSDLLSINYLPQTKFLKASSEFLLKRARDLYIKYDNFQMIAGGNRSECISLFNKLLTIKDIKTHDIQYLLDNNKIN